MDRFDSKKLKALAAIGAIVLREWPVNERLFVFHESFESDARLVVAFCRDRRVFGRNSKQLIRKWEAVNYLHTPIFLYYLPAVLLAMLEHPKSQFCQILLIGQLARSEEVLSPEERVAAREVRACLEESGVTVEAIWKRIEEGKQRARDLGYKVREFRK